MSITNPTNNLSGSVSGRDFMYLLEQVKELTRRVTGTEQEMDIVQATLDGYKSEFTTNELSAINSELENILADNIVMRRNLIQRIMEPGNYVMAYYGNNIRNIRVSDPIELTGVLETSGDTIIAMEGTSVPVLGHVIPTAPVTTQAGGPAITWLRCDVEHKDFDILAIWTAHSIWVCYSQNAFLPINNVSVIARTTDNAPGDPARLMLDISPEAFNPSGAGNFEVQVYGACINGTVNNISYREQHRDEDATAYLRKTGGTASNDNSIEVTDAFIENLTVNTLRVKDFHYDLEMIHPSLLNDTKYYVASLNNSNLEAYFTITAPSGIVCRARVETSGMSTLSVQIEQSSPSLEPVIIKHVGIEQAVIEDRTRTAIYVITGSQANGMNMRAFAFNGDLFRIGPAYPQGGGLSVECTQLAHNFVLPHDVGDNVIFKNLTVLEDTTINNLTANEANIEHLDLNTGTIATLPTHDNDIANRIFVTDMIAEAMSTALIFMGVALESEVLAYDTTDLANGSFFIVSDFDVTHPGAVPTVSGAMYWHKEENHWDSTINDYSDVDNITINRDGLGHIQVAPDWIADHVVQSVNGNTTPGSSLTGTLGGQHDVQIMFGPYADSTSLTDAIPTIPNNSLILSTFDNAIRYKDNNGDVSIWRFIVGDTTIHEYNLTAQMSGSTQTFELPTELHNANIENIAVYYGGQRLVNGINYTLDVSVNPPELITLLDEPPTANNNRQLIVTLGEIIYTNAPGPGGNAEWGSITGTITDQTDLVQYIRTNPTTSIKHYDGTFNKTPLLTTTFNPTDIIGGVADVINGQTLLYDLEGTVAVVTNLDANTAMTITTMGVNSVDWGDITGNITDQTDLIDYIDDVTLWKKGVPGTYVQNVDFTDPQAWWDENMKNRQFEDNVRIELSHLPSNTLFNNVVFNQGKQLDLFISAAAGDWLDIRYINSLNIYGLVDHINIIACRLVGIQITTFVDLTALNSNLYFTHPIAPSGSLTTDNCNVFISDRVECSGATTNGGVINIKPTGYLSLLNNRINSPVVDERPGNPLELWQRKGTIGSVAAIDVTYNNAASSLTDNNVQDAIDHLDNKHENLSTQVTNIDNYLGDLTAAQVKYSSPSAPFTNVQQAIDYLKSQTDDHDDSIGSLTTRVTTNENNIATINSNLNNKADKVNRTLYNGATQTVNLSDVVEPNYMLSYNNDGLVSTRFDANGRLSFAGKLDLGVIGIAYNGYGRIDLDRAQGGGLHCVIPIASSTELGLMNSTDKVAIDSFDGRISNVEDIKADKVPISLSDGATQTINLQHLIDLTATGEHNLLSFDRDSNNAYNFSSTKDRGVDDFAYTPGHRLISIGRVADSTLNVQIPEASTTVDGLMTVEDVETLIELKSKVDSLSVGGVWRATYATYVALVAAHPNYPEVDEPSWAEHDYVIVESDSNHSGAMTRYIMEGTPLTLSFQRLESSPPTPQATNSSLGTVMGSSSDGKIYVESDGSMSLNGYDGLITAIDSKYTLPNNGIPITDLHPNLQTQIENAAIKTEQNIFTGQLNTFRSIMANEGVITPAIGSATGALNYSASRHVFDNRIEAPELRTDVIRNASTALDNYINLQGNNINYHAETLSGTGTGPREHIFTGLGVRVEGQSQLNGEVTINDDLTVSGKVVTPFVQSAAIVQTAPDDGAYAAWLELVSVNGDIAMSAKGGEGTIRYNGRTNFQEQAIFYKGVDSTVADFRGDINLNGNKILNADIDISFSELVIPYYDNPSKILFEIANSPGQSHSVKISADNADLTVEGSLIELDARGTYADISLYSANDLRLRGDGLVSLEGNILLDGAVTVEDNLIARDVSMTELEVNGQATINGNLDMSNNRITNLAGPTASTDAARQQDVINAVSNNFTVSNGLVKTSGGTTSNPTTALSLANDLVLASNPTQYNKTIVFKGNWPNSDLNDIVTVDSGIYNVPSTVDNTPAEQTGTYTRFVILYKTSGNGANSFQIFIKPSTGEQYTRGSITVNAGTWTPWVSSPTNVSFSVSGMNTSANGNAGITGAINGNSIQLTQTRPTYGTTVTSPVYIYRNADNSSNYGPTAVTSTIADNLGVGVHNISSTAWTNGPRGIPFNSTANAATLSIYGATSTRRIPLLQFNNGSLWTRNNTSTTMNIATTLNNGWKHAGVSAFSPLSPWMWANAALIDFNDGTFGYCWRPNITAAANVASLSQQIVHIPHTTGNLIHIINWHGEIRSSSNSATSGVSSTITNTLSITKPSSTANYDVTIDWTTTTPSARTNTMGFVWVHFMMVDGPVV